MSRSALLSRVSPSATANNGALRLSHAISIVLHNSSRELQALLSSIDAQLASRPQVICVDSGSSDDGAEVARAWGAELIVMEGNPGYGAANNAAIELINVSTSAGAGRAVARGARQKAVAATR